MKSLIYCLASVGIAGGAVLTLTFAAEATPGSVESILKSYIDDFRTDDAAREARTFGIEIKGDDGGTWTVRVSGEADSEGRFGVEMRRGLPQKPTFVYETNVETLVSIDRGHVNPITAQGKAFASDDAPLEVRFMDGATRQDINAFSFHFWTRGFPEKVPFHRDLSRVLHGVNTIGLYYQPGIRTIWASIEQGQRANNGPNQPIVVPFPAMVIVIKGCATGHLNGKPVKATEGEMVFIPPMTPYEWWNEAEVPAEALLVFFGEGA